MQFLWDGGATVGPQGRKQQCRSEVSKAKFVYAQVRKYTIHNWLKLLIPKLCAASLETGRRQQASCIVPCYCPSTAHATVLAPRLCRTHQI